MQLRIRRDAAVCGKIPETEYHPELGARSLVNGVETIEDMLVNSYLDIDGKIAETNSLVDFMVDVNGGEIVASMVMDMTRGGEDLATNKEGHALVIAYVLFFY